MERDRDHSSQAKLSKGLLPVWILYLPFWNHPSCLMEAVADLKKA